MMLNCWKENPRSRPTFSELCLQIESMMENCTDRDYLELELDLNRDYYTVESESDEQSVLQGEDEFGAESDHTLQKNHVQLVKEISEEVREVRPSLKPETVIEQLEITDRDIPMLQTGVVKHSDVMIEGGSALELDGVKRQPDVVKENISTLKLEVMTEDPKDNLTIVKEGRSTLKQGNQETDCSLDTGSCQELSTSKDEYSNIIPTEEYIEKVTFETKYPLQSHCDSADLTDIVPNFLCVHHKHIAPENDDLHHSKPTVSVSSNMNNYATPITGELGIMVQEYIHSKQDAEPITVSESSDSNIEQDLDDVFTDEDGNSCECMYSPTGNVVCEHIDISSGSISDSQAKCKPSITGSQYLIPTSDDHFPRTESLVSTTSIDSGFPQSPVQRDDAYYVPGIRVSGVYKKAARTRLYSSSRMWHRLKRRHAVFQVSECCPSMTD